MVTVAAYHCCSLNTTLHSTLFRPGPGDHQCGFASNKSATDQLLCIQQILFINWEFNGAVHQLFVDQHRVRLS